MGSAPPEPGVAERAAMPTVHRIDVRLSDSHLRDALGEYLQGCPGLAVRGAEDAALPAALVVADRTYLEAAAAEDLPVLVLDTGPRPATVALADFVECPVRFAELVRRIEARLHENQERDVRYRVGAAEFCVAARRLQGADRSCVLAEQEARALSYLCRAGNRSVPRDELLRVVWGYAPNTETHTVETHIWQLRVALRDSGAGEVLHHRDGGYTLQPPAAAV